MEKSKPTNILISYPRGALCAQLKLADFGLLSLRNEEGRSLNKPSNNVDKTFNSIGNV